MSVNKAVHSEGEERYSTLVNNAAAVRAICSAVEGTLGPKGLDTMLVGGQGEVIITNDGVTILEKMDVTHPAARLMIQVARSQQRQIGDGTTTATVLAGALVQEGVAQVTRGVPVAKVVSGMLQGIELAVTSLQGRSRAIAGLDDSALKRIAITAGREQADIAGLIIQAAEAVGEPKLREEGYRFADSVLAHEAASSEVWTGILLNQKPMNLHLEDEARRDLRILVLHDALEPEAVSEESLVTEAGFQRYMQLREQFRSSFSMLLELGVGLIASDRGVDPEAEQFCSDHGILVLQRLSRRDLQLLSEHTGARPVRRTALRKSAPELGAALGHAGYAAYDERLERVRVAGGRGDQHVTVIVGAATREAAHERSRIAKDAASAVQAAVRGGYLPGGGAAEMAVAHDLDRARETMKGMEGFGVAAVAGALRKPLAQIVVNAGYNPLEKVEELKAAQLALETDSLGIDCDTGQVTDFVQVGIVDPADVKIHALQAAGEVAAAVLRIHTVIKMKQPFEEA
ncbi:TCP-1/cpn60 chaperonin family protein [Paenibacillus sp. HWE-109]|uniref:TCP-1/cpn60 chaperonin family protein n=1 Tax=Paenibacillus sp. HWE-109 TaxID=1306526 RepID=UPI001EE0BA3B|nr:TCP-1/cpn60 chaperonin family protein [Paenibacillus sp. HWE-109]UKS30379.1 TCP-1/cpn60 chaperonin family protein [Paenibacillus sp. HWE-109]